MDKFNKLKRICAIMAVILLIALYLVTLILAFMQSPQARLAFTGCIYATIGIPVVLYAMILAYKYLSGRRD